MKFPPIQDVTSTVVKTAQCAEYLQLTRSTLCSFAKKADAPIRPLRIGKQYFWQVADIKALLNVAQGNTNSQAAGVTE